MKKILHIVFFIFINLSLFGQTPNGNLSDWNNISKVEINPVEIKIYPNPLTQQKLTIETTNTELAEIRITNITGKVVLLKNYDLPVSKVELILQNAPNGIYLVQVKTSVNKVISRKLVITG